MSSAAVGRTGVSDDTHPQNLHRQENNETESVADHMTCSCTLHVL